MNSAAKVGEIFSQAGTAFKLLGELTMELIPIVDSPPGSKWTDEEINMLKWAITHFCNDLNEISLRIKSRTVSQIRQTLKKKCFEDAGVPVKQMSMAQAQEEVPPLSLLAPSTVISHKADVKSESLRPTTSSMVVDASQLEQSDIIADNIKVEPELQIPNYLNLFASADETTLNRLNTSGVKMASVDPSEFKLEF